MKEHISIIDIPPVVNVEVVEMVKYQWDISTQNLFNEDLKLINSNIHFKIRIIIKKNIEV